MAPPTPGAPVTPPDLPPADALAATVTAGAIIPPASQAPIVEQMVLDELLEAMGPGGEPVLAEFMTAYVQNAEEMVASMENCLTTQDAVELHRTAHSFKSSSASLGAMRVSAESLGLEMELRQAQKADQPPDWASAAERVARIRAELVHARERLLAIAEVWGQMPA